jgi:hypothetical protein
VYRLFVCWFFYTESLLSNVIGGMSVSSAWGVQWYMGSLKTVALA